MKEPLKIGVRIGPVVGALLLLSASVTLGVESEDGAGDPEDIPALVIRKGKSTYVESAPIKTQPLPPSLSSHARPHSRHRRQAFDGFRFTDMFRIFNEGALEGVDSLLRSTRNFDVFQCLERISCEMAAPLSDSDRPLTLETIETSSRSFMEAFNPPSDVLDEEIVEEPADAALAGVVPQQLQPGQVSPFVQPGFPFFPQAPFIQPYPAFPGYPYYPYPQLLQQGLQTLPAPAVNGQGLSANVEAPVRSAENGAHPMVHAASTMPMTIKRRNDVRSIGSQDKNVDFSSRSFFAGYRDRMARTKRTYSNWWRNFKRKLMRRKRDLSRTSVSANVLKRRKRGIMNSLKKVFNGRQIVGVLDRMMEGTDDSIYPYTRAALMGYTGSHNMCEELYPNCPTSMDEVIDTFNNLRNYFPEGIPFRNRIPAPFRYLVP